ncbi:hypothetical protein V498_07866 [Pseudogymnoascus sp. VKM F-4517 (FW-2822)]|nr:hypothetical protein V498_07866 [Pseudogymnoascus sp. VKM F-4517 (FW-2822)]
MTVRDAAGGQLLEILATFELPDLKSALCEQEPALIKALSFAISCLPKVRDNPALREGTTLAFIDLGISGEAALGTYRDVGEPNSGDGE